MKASLAAILLAALAEGAVTGAWNSSTQESQESQLSESGGKEFTLTQVKNEGFTGRDGPMAFMRAHMKYTQKLPDFVLEAVNSSSELGMKYAAFSQVGKQMGSVAAHPTHGADSEYAVMVRIGSPPQSIPMNLDTGSADFWVLSTDTDQKMLKGQALYRPASSSSSRRLVGEKWNIKYGDGSSASGILYLDTVQIGGTRVLKMGIESPYTVSNDIANDKFVSGILGLANSAANTVRPVPQGTYLDHIHGQLAQPILTANLRRGAPGNYNFGFINRGEYTGNIQYTPVDQHHPLWKISASGYRVGSKQSQLKIDAIVDTGTSLALLPQRVVDELYSQIQGSFRHPKLGMMVFPCKSKLPDFFLSIGPYNGRLPGEYINYAPIDHENCYGGIQTSAGLPFSVLGDVFLKAQFVVFDYGHQTVGFANKKL
ncbi:hypothetical protein E4U22_000498 [Claviceps purpurea]|nr:hypothetical protein E4U27_007122 [Claviceps purpurea]KAG6209449.1 hypothetical protein E4U35_007106 [Claviceps purpurea]KAG6290081.1 hypothetical protein E4U46_002040 [Claviceps purpurea]KAG6313908.1 hypothetical protein E4U22_000498 [Claviceps purpurea]